MTISIAPKNKYCHSRKGQGKGVPRPWGESFTNPERFCPWCGYEFGPDARPVTVLLDRKHAAIKEWIPKRLDGHYVTICDSYCAPMLLTRHFRREGPEEEPQRTNFCIEQDRDERHGHEDGNVCLDCGEPVSDRSRCCVKCAKKYYRKDKRKVA